MSFDKRASIDSKEELYQLLLDQIRESRLVAAANSYTKKDSLKLSDSAKDIVARHSDHIIQDQSFTVKK
jgi:hypothetical protein